MKILRELHLLHVPPNPYDFIAAMQAGEFGGCVCGLKNKGSIWVGDLTFEISQIPNNESSSSFP